MDGISIMNVTSISNNFEERKQIVRVGLTPPSMAHPMAERCRCKKPEVCPTIQKEYCQVGLYGKCHKCRQPLPSTIDRPQFRPRHRRKHPRSLYWLRMV